ncbi:hypothetical protein D3C73_1025110 [compost metagenome]
MVSNDSINPTKAITTAYGSTTFSISRLNGAIGRLKCGKAPEISARSPTRKVCRLNPIASAETTIRAANEAGITRVSRGNSTTTPIASATSPYISSPCPAIICSCASMMTIAKPFTKPWIAGSGTRRINLPSRKTPIRIWITPAKIVAHNT